MDPKAIEYVRKQMKAGFTRQQIRVALLREGWTAREIDDILAAAGAQQEEELILPSNSTAFFLSASAAILIAVNGILFVFDEPIGAQLRTAGLISADTSIAAFFPGLGLFQVGFLACVFAFGVGIGAFLAHRPAGERSGGFLILFLSVLSFLFAGGGFLVGSALGLLGGIHAVSNSRFQDQLFIRNS